MSDASCICLALLGALLRAELAAELPVDLVEIMAAAFDALGDTIEGVIKGIQEKWRESEGEPGILDALRGFSAAVDWRVKAF